MGNYRVKNPIPVMVKEGDGYVLRTVPKGTLLAIEETPLNLTRHVIVNWSGKNALMFARDLMTHAELASDDAPVEPFGAPGQS